MNAMRIGFVGAGVFHGALLIAALFYAWAGERYRSALRIDFNIMANGESGKSSGTPNTARRTPPAAAPTHAAADATPSENEASQETGTAQENGTGDDASKDGGYVRANFTGVSNLIHARLYYPRVAREQGWQGSVTIQFWVDTEGCVSGVSIAQRSGYDVLDQSALDAVKELTGLPKPPAPVLLSVPVHFRLR